MGSTGPSPAEAMGAAQVALDVLVAARLTPADIAERQRARLAAVLPRVHRECAFHARQWRGRTGRVDRLADWPPVRKAALMAHFDEWVTDPAVTLAALRAFTADPARAGEPFLGRYTVWESSGSTGEPAIFVQDPAAMAVYEALEGLRRAPAPAWQRWLDPFRLGERFAFVGALEGHFASHVSLQRLRRLRPWLAAGWRSFSILQPGPKLLAQLQAFGPTLIATYPTAAAWLADEAARGTLSIHPRELWTGGETLGPAVRRHVEQALGCTLRNSYGASEFLPLAWECGSQRLHLNADWVVLEPVDARGRPVPPGQWSHDVWLTHLANTVQPLVRYALGDQVRLDPGRCDCGSPLPVLEVRGRCDEALQLRGRDGGRVTLLPLALSTVLEEQAGVHDFQLCQTGADALRLALGPGTPPDAARACREALRDFAERQRLAPIHLRIVRGTALRRGRSGKQPRILCRPPRPGPESPST